VIATETQIIGGARLISRHGGVVADGRRRRSKGRFSKRYRTNLKPPAGRLRELPTLEPIR
jgi:hypothetical protein